MIRTTFPGLSHSNKVEKGEERKRREGSLSHPRVKKKSFPCRIQKNKTRGKLWMDYTTLTPPPITVDETERSELAVGHSLYEALQHLPDPRRGQGKRYDLALLLCLLLLAKLAGQTTLCGATEWIRHRAEVMAAHFGLKRKHMPCQMTYCRILAHIDAQHLDEVLANFFICWEAQQRCGNEPSRLQTSQGLLDHAHLALDGKTVGATSKQEHPVHLLSCYDVTTGTVLWQCHVQDKENEISAL